MGGKCSRRSEAAGSGGEEALKDVRGVGQGEGDEAHEGAGECEQSRVVALGGFLEDGGRQGGRVDVWVHDEAFGEGERVRGRKGGQRRIGFGKTTR